MPTNLDGLKAIYEALGGQADDVTSVDTNADMLMKIAAPVSYTHLTLPTICSV